MNHSNKHSWSASAGIHSNNINTTSNISNNSGSGSGSHAVGNEMRSESAPLSSSAAFLYSQHIPQPQLSPYYYSTPPGSPSPGYLRNQQQQQLSNNNSNASFASLSNRGNTISNISTAMSDYPVQLLQQQQQQQHLHHPVQKHTRQHSAGSLMSIHRPPGHTRHASGSFSRALFGNSINSIQMLTQTQSSPLVAPSRSNPEVLKTLLRKKACLYEADTSLAVALVTWLVGRELGVKYGYFSRQQLQTGVHNVVNEKIENGVITRTKVNRCMQIILNSCFHYIIPRPDGVETGEVFKAAFADSSSDETELLSILSAPWDDLDMSMAFVESTDGNDLLEGASDGAGPVGAVVYEEDKRPVLLCFNDNVRSFDKAYHCHNEFIRDTATASEIHLNAEEWKRFFSGDSADEGGSAGGTATTTSSLSHPVSSFDPHPTAVGGGNHDDINDKQTIAVDFSISSIHHERKSSNTSATTTTTSASSGCIAMSHRSPYETFAIISVTDPKDTLGKFNHTELCKFRASWCEKRYEHDLDLCGFAHPDINGGWLKRDPRVYNYSDTLCPNIIMNKMGVFNKCSKGVDCEYAHSQEEIDYHPKRYKTLPCPRGLNHNMMCDLKELCPFLHNPSSSFSLNSSNDNNNTVASSIQGSGVSGGGQEQQQQQQRVSATLTRSSIVTAAYNLPPPLQPPTPQQHTHIMMPEVATSGNISSMVMPGFINLGMKGGHMSNNTGVGGSNSSGSTASPYPSAHPMMYISPAPHSNFEEQLMVPGFRELFRRRCSTVYVCAEGATQEMCSYSPFGADWGLPRTYSIKADDQLTNSTRGSSSK